MYVIQSFEKGLYTVGFFAPDGKWHPHADYTSIAEAERMVNYLNGGKGLEATA